MAVFGDCIPIFRELSGQTFTNNFHGLGGITGMHLFTHLLEDEAGFVVSSELVLVATLLVLGMIVGLSEVRNSVVQELTDLGQTFGTVNQSYSFNGVAGHVSSTAGSFRLDLLDFCELAADATASEPGCVAIGGAATITATSEG